MLRFVLFVILVAGVQVEAGRSAKSASRADMNGRTSEDSPSNTVVKIERETSRGGGGGECSGLLCGLGRKRLTSSPYELAESSSRQSSRHTSKHASKHSSRQSSRQSSTYQPATQVHIYEWQEEIRDGFLQDIPFEGDDSQNFIPNAAGVNLNDLWEKGIAYLTRGDSADTRYAMSRENYPAPGRQLLKGTAGILKVVSVNFYRFDTSLYVRLKADDIGLQSDYVFYRSDSSGSPKQELIDVAKLVKQQQLRVEV
eukprot:Lankesteria_metandrocarpae@DN173_c0_g1_i1.p1